MTYDPWQNAVTKNGYHADEVISALQKCIRRAQEEEACMFAYELYLTSPELEDKLWSRLLTISVEDVGMGNPLAAVIVNQLNQIRKQFDVHAVDRPLFFIHAIRVLCSSEKDRSSDMLKNIVEHRIKTNDFPEIPDVALDMHTRRGQQIGRGIDHFLNEASYVTPEMKVKNDYKERLKRILETK
ncbi:MAG: hypothetical protein E7192_07735 [Erysipelotrichaceae bacterium]|nr:hypothetical protein [Erysipelotrichaceae bacterium]